MNTKSSTPDDDETPRKAKVAPARRQITKGRDLLAACEGKHVALMPLRFGEHTFQGEDEATATVDVAVVDVSSDPARPVAVLSVSWKRIVGALRMAEPGTWQVGRLIREEEYQAVELLEPEPEFDLDRAALQLAELEHPGRPAQQLVLPVAEPAPAEDPEPAEMQEDEGIDDGIVF